MANIIRKRGNRSESAPLYRQIEAHIRRQIETGELRPGELLPSNRTLCDQFGGVNHLTVRQALKRLTDAKLVHSVQGKGTFITPAATRHQRISFVAPYLEDSLAVRVAEGVQSVLDKQSIHTLILDSRRNLQKEIDNIRHLRELPIDGAIILASSNGSIVEQVVAMKQAGFPFVLVDRYFAEIQTACVVVDNYNGCYQLAQHVLRSGRRKFAWVGEINVTSVIDRHQGFRDALNDAGVAMRRDFIFDTNLPTPASPFEEEVDAIARKIALKTAEIDAVICINDSVALRLMQTLKSLGIDIPLQIAVAGFDDMPQSQSSDPPLTSVRQHMEQMGIEAANLLLERIHSPELPLRKVTLPVEVIARQSA